jgi:hypothetical protein
MRLTVNDYQYPIPVHRGEHAGHDVSLLFGISAKYAQLYLMEGAYRVFRQVRKVKSVRRGQNSSHDQDADIRYSSNNVS